MRRALVIAVAMAAVLSSCAAEPPVPSPSPGAPSASASAPVSPSPTASSIALDHPPACLDAKLLWADALNRLILANCVDQFDLASLETVWAWDGERWELLSDDGPPATVVTGFGWDPARDVLVRYGGIPLPEQDCITETWEWDMTEWREVEAEPPEPCDHIELAWDAISERTLLVGGGRGPDLMPGTWAWDGSEWIHLTDLVPRHVRTTGWWAPSTGVTSPYMAASTTANCSTITGNGTDLRGRRWAEPGGLTPGPRSHHGLALGPDGLVLFGGATGNSTFESLVDDTWIEDQISGWGPVGNGAHVRRPVVCRHSGTTPIVRSSSFTAASTPTGIHWRIPGNTTSPVVALHRRLLSQATA